MTDTTTTEPRQEVIAGRAPSLAAAAAGAIAAGSAIAVSEVIAGLVPGAPSLVVSIGTLVIDLQPPGAKDLVVRLFGTNDKLALNLIVIVIALALGAVFGLVGRRHWWAAVAGASAVGVVALFAAARLPLISTGLAILTCAASVGVSLLVLRWLLASIDRRPADEPGGARPVASMPDWGRRAFLVRAGSVALGSAALGVVGRALLDRQGPSSATGSLPAPSLPAPSLPAPTLPPAATIDVPGITPLVVPPTDFYRIDTALIVPRVDVSTWKLQVTGMVDRPVSLAYADLVAMPQLEQYVTIACVSNEVGGDLVGNALWSGVHLRDVLDMAGVQAGATQIVGRSVDGFTVGFPTEWAMDPARDPMIALGMDGAPLPVDHGYPARLIVPGLYGYVSATKWLREIELTTMAFDAYWVPLGWAKEAPILTQSRIDVPRSGARLTAGPVVAAGVAWAPDRGVAKVEVRLDDGPWAAAMMSAPISTATWVQWRYDWTATAGDHQIEVRATDGTGDVQTTDVTPPAPDGARGHHRIFVHVS